MTLKKRIGLHLCYWFLYSGIIYFCFYLLTVIQESLSPDSNHYLTVHNTLNIFGATILPAALSFYLSYFFAFERNFVTKKYIVLTINLLRNALLSGFIGALFVSYIVNNPAQSTNLVVLIFKSISFSIIPFIQGAIALLIRGFESWIRERHLREQAQRKALETELQLVKAQLNPHFLFNSLNNIDALLIKNPTEASEYLHKISDILRVMLYERRERTISLEQEIFFLQSYVDIQKIRMVNPERTHFEVIGSLAEIKIAPLLFLPYLENAFKYFDKTEKDNRITILFEIEPTQIRFTCSNHYRSKDQFTITSGGIGNELVQKRIQLLYPTAQYYQETKNNIFVVQWLIPLN